MSYSSHKFSLVAVFEHSISREISIDCAAPVRSCLRSLRVTCEACGHVWESSKSGSGRFISGIDAFNVKCPSCNSQERINYSSLK